MYKISRTADPKTFNEINKLPDQRLPLFSWMIDTYFPGDDVKLVVLDEKQRGSWALKNITTDAMTLFLTKDLQNILFSQRWSYVPPGKILVNALGVNVPAEKIEYAKNLFIDVNGLDSPAYRTKILSSILPGFNRINLDDTIKTMLNGNIFWLIENINVRIHGDLAGESTLVKGQGVAPCATEAMMLVKSLYFEDWYDIENWSSLWREAKCGTIYSPNYGTNIIIEAYADFNLISSILQKDEINKLREEYEKTFYSCSKSKEVSIVW